MIESNKKKYNIGILTMHCVPNYGAILQAYATVTFFRRASETFFNGAFDIEIVDYQPIEKKKRYSTKAWLVDSAKSPKRFLRNIRNYSRKSVNISKDLHGKAYDFFRSVQCLSKEADKNDLIKLNEKYDALVVGSDQVWNPYGMKDDYSYLLSFFESGSRYSFSSSFGISEFPIEYEGIYSLNLRKFKHVSVREETGLKIYAKLTGRDDGIVLLDPTFMLSSEDYKNLENKGTDYSYTPGYTLVYLAMNSDTLVKYAKNHKEKGKDIILFGMPDMVCNLCESGCKIVKSATIGDFLSLFHNASKVFTNSFHGIAFSIIYGKDVWIEWNNVQSKSNSRLENIVKKFGLENRIINEPIVDQPINYDMINRIINNERKKAMDYIKQMMLEIRKG